MHGFTNATFAVLRDLAEHNSKEWMDGHRDEYRREVRAPAEAIAAAWAEALRPHGYAPMGKGVSPMHHDRRFVRGPTYRTHVAIRMRHHNALPGAPGPTFLLWIQPRNCFLAAGVHAHNGESLRRIRTAIIEDPEGWGQVRDLGDLDDTDMAATAPEGPFHEDRLRRHYTITRPLTQRVVMSEFPQALIDQSLEMLPFADFTARALYTPGSVATHPIP